MDYVSTTTASATRIRNGIGTATASPNDKNLNLALLGRVGSERAGHDEPMNLVSINDGDSTTSSVKRDATHRFP
jgi:hypothetical protein